MISLRPVKCGAPLTIELTLLGQFSLTRDGQPVELKNRKARALLAYLAMTPGRAHSREKLAGLLWGERFEDQARASLRQALHALRRALGPEVVTGDGEVMVPEGAIAVDARVVAARPARPAAPSLRDRPATHGRHPAAC